MSWPSEQKTTAFPYLAPARGAKGKAGGKKGAAAAATGPAGVSSDERKRDHVPIAIYEGMENPPIAADSEYPEWVFSLTEGKLSVAEMELEGVDTFPIAKQIQYANLKHRGLIKGKNSLSAA